MGAVKSGHGVAPSEQTSFAIAMTSGRGPGEDRVRPRCVPQPKLFRGARDFIRFGRDAEPPQQARQLVDARRVRRLGLFAACVQRL